MPTSKITRPSTLLAKGLEVMERKGRAIGAFEDDLGRVCATQALSLSSPGISRTAGAARRYLDRAARMLDPSKMHVVHLNDDRLDEQEANPALRGSTTRKVKAAYRLAIAEARKDEQRLRQRNSRAARKLKTAMNDALVAA